MSEMDKPEKTGAWKGEGKQCQREVAESNGKGKTEKVRRVAVKTKK